MCDGIKGTKKYSLAKYLDINQDHIEIKYQQEKECLLVTNNIYYSSFDSHRETPAGFHALDLVKVEARNEIYRLSNFDLKHYGRGVYWAEDKQGDNCLILDFLQDGWYRKTINDLAMKKLKPLLEDFIVNQINNLEDDSYNILINPFDKQNLDYRLQDVIFNPDKLNSWYYLNIAMSHIMEEYFREKQFEHRVEGTNTAYIYKCELLPYLAIIKIPTEDRTENLFHPDKVEKEISLIENLEILSELELEYSRLEDIFIFINQRLRSYIDVYWQSLANENNDKPKKRYFVNCILKAGLDQIQDRNVSYYKKVNSLLPELMLDVFKNQ